MPLELRCFNCKELFRPDTLSSLGLCIYCNFDKNRRSKSNNGLKHDSEKPMANLLSPHAMLGTAAVLTYGAAKYSAENWRAGIKWGRIIAALFRHMFAFMMGEDLDPESGLPHIDHAAVNIMFLQEFFRTRKDLDDRYVANKEVK